MAIISSKQPELPSRQGEFLGEAEQTPAFDNPLRSLAQLVMRRTVSGPLEVVTEPGQEPVASMIESDERDVRDLLDTNELTRGNYEVVPIAEAGVIIKLGETPLVPGNDFIAYDLDDTAVAYSEARAVRLAAYEAYATQYGLQLSPEASSMAMAVTDKFARWIADGRDTYNVAAHMASLAWVSDQLKALPADMRNETIIAELGSQLAAAKNPNVAGDGVAKDLPFFFRDGHFTITNTELVSAELSAVFTPMIQPETYQDTIEAMHEIGAMAGTPHQVNEIILTYGNVDFQLAKTLAMLSARAAAGEALPISQIWLTRVPKGEFMAALAKSLHSETLSDAKITAEEIFNHGPHVMVLVDDAPTDLTSFENQANELADLPVMTASMRYRREGTKRTNVPWESGRQLLPGVSATYNGPPEIHGRSLADELLLTLAALAKQAKSSLPQAESAMRRKLMARQAAYEQRAGTEQARGNNVSFLPGVTPLAEPAAAKPESDYPTVYRRSSLSGRDRRVLSELLLRHAGEMLPNWYTYER